MLKILKNITIFLQKKYNNVISSRFNFFFIIHAMFVTTCFDLYCEIVISSNMFYIFANTTIVVSYSYKI